MSKNSVDIDPLHRGYPRPLLARPTWTNLNGEWDFAIDALGKCESPSDVTWDRKIIVPFAPETEASGVGETGFFRAVWYAREFETPEFTEEHRILLHFGAVDFAATVWVDEMQACAHEGGYTPFCADITEFLQPGHKHRVVVRVEDDPADLAKPRGKQDWQLEPHSIWYPRTTGIWQTVWMEKVPSTYIDTVRFTPVMERWEIGFELHLKGAVRDGLRLTIKLKFRDQLIADDTYTVVAGEVTRRIAFSDPGIDDYRNEMLWTPGTPNIIDVEMKLWSGRGELVDQATSYTALRSIGVQGDRFTLNGRPYPLHLILDQGYWPETGLTPRDEEAIKLDIQLTKAMGFNGVRKHQKIEDPRFLYWADVMGLMVWEEMPSAYRYTKLSIARLTREWVEVIDRDFSHPCIVAWVPFNESWGVPDLPDSPAQRHYVQALYHLTKTLDPTRPVIGNDGWESVATDIVGIHDYDVNAERIGKRYGGDEALPRLFKRERPGGRILVLGDTAQTNQPIMLTEFGGVSFGARREEWGYTKYETLEEYALHVLELLSVVRSLNVLAGFCYTQLTDTYQEANGLLYADRTPKIPIEDIEAALKPPSGKSDTSLEWAWRERLMNTQRDQYLVPKEDYQTHK